MEIKENPPLSPELSGAPPADLTGLREWQASRTHSSIIEARRAAQALAASRMAATVAVDKLEARVDQAARELLNHARDKGGTLEMALEDFRDFDPSLVGEMGERVLNRAQDLDGEVAASTPRRRFRSCRNPYRRGDY